MGDEVEYYKRMLHLIPHVTFIERYMVFAQNSPILILERCRFVMLMLRFNVLFYSRDGLRTHGERTVSTLPIEVSILGALSFNPIGRMAF